MPFTSLTVLVVDDDAFARDLLSEMLGSLGITQTLMAENGQAALALLAALPKPPDCMVCDVYMPDMDGIELIGALANQRYPGGVILLSGVDVQMLALAQDIATANDIALLGAFVKPVTTETLASALRKIAVQPRR